LGVIAGDMHEGVKNAEDNEHPGQQDDQIAGVM
jgi:hypothetical protein